MHYRIAETEPYQVFGTDAMQIDGWNTVDFLQYADRVIHIKKICPACFSSETGQISISFFTC